MMSASLVSLLQHQVICWIHILGISALSEWEDSFCLRDIYQSLFFSFPVKTAAFSQVLCQWAYTYSGEKKGGGRVIK